MRTIIFIILTLWCQSLFSSEASFSSMEAAQVWYSDQQYRGRDQDGPLVMRIQIESEHKEQMLAYAKLQKMIAKELPSEYQRPIIHTQFIWQPDEEEESPVVRILGGMGPISDGHLLAKIAVGLVNGASYHNLYLLSMPPPRTFAQVLWGSANYGLTLKSFLGDHLGPVILASNTAHIYRTWLSILVGEGTEILDMVEEVSRQIKGEGRRVLILATEKSQKAQLYPSRLEAGQYLLPSAPLAQATYLLIDEIKGGSWNAFKQSEWESLLLQSTAKDKYDSILLGCTELSTAIGMTKRNWDTLELQIIDSESIFAQKALKLLSQDNLKENL